MRASAGISTPWTAALIGAAVAFSAAAVAQGRLSLSERVTRLEQQLQGNNAQDNQVEMLNRLNEMQAELRSLRNVVERQAFEIEQLKRDQRNQYLDLDSRLQALSGSAPVGPTPGSTPAPTVDSGAFETLPGAGAALGNADGPTAALPPIRDVPAPAPAPGADERAAYDRAFEALKQGRYEQSARLFAEFLRAYPAGEFADNATYWLGESHYVSEDYATALKTFESLLQNFPNSSKAADALLKVGYCQYQLGQTQQAVSTLNDVVARYPNTPVARLAQVRLRSLQLEQR